MHKHFAQYKIYYNVNIHINLFLQIRRNSNLFEDFGQHLLNALTK